MTCTFDFVVDDNFVLAVTCQDAVGAAIDLTGAVVSLQWLSSAGIPVTRTNITYVDRPAGKISYEFQIGESYSPEMEIDIVIVSGGKTFTNTCPLVIKGRKQVA